MFKKLLLTGLMCFPIATHAETINLSYSIINTNMASNFDLDENDINKCNGINQCILKIPISFQQKLMYINTFDCGGSSQDYKIDIKVVYKKDFLCYYANVGWPLGDFINIYHQDYSLENLLLVRPLNKIMLSDLNHSNQLPNDRQTELIVNTKIQTAFQGYPIGALYETPTQGLLFLTKTDDRHLMYFILPKDIFLEMSKNPDITIKIGQYYLVNLSDKKDELERYFKYADDSEYPYWNKKCEVISTKNYVSDFFNNKDLIYEAGCLKKPINNYTIGYNASYPYFEPIDIILKKKIGDNK